MIDDLRHFRAPRPVNPWHCLAFAACMFLIASVDAAQMPPAERIFERRAELRKLTAPSSAAVSRTTASGSGTASAPIDLCR